tara:strand:+ start:2269 stop:2523 length:255 start_codon:yes stop_codon:yes gene_type:complete
MAIRIRENIILEKLDDQIVILNIDDGIFYELNTVGTAILEEIKKNRDYKDLLDSIVNNFGIQRSEAKKDLDDFLSNLEEMGILE